MMAVFDDSNNRYNYENINITQIMMMTADENGNNFSMNCLLLLAGLW